MTEAIMQDLTTGRWMVHAIRIASGGGYHPGGVTTECELAVWQDRIDNGVWKRTSSTFEEIDEDKKTPTSMICQNCRLMVKHVLPKELEESSEEK